MFPLFVEIQLLKRRGHYTASVCIDGLWFLFNDADVKQLPENYDLCTDAYLLIFQKKT